MLGFICSAFVTKWRSSRTNKGQQDNSTKTTKSKISIMKIKNKKRAGAKVKTNIVKIIISNRNSTNISSIRKSKWYC
jgi:hypothetical protein